MTISRFCDFRYFSTRNFWSSTFSTLCFFVRAVGFLQITGIGNRYPYFLFTFLKRAHRARHFALLDVRIGPRSSENGSKTYFTWPPCWVLNVSFFAKKETFNTQHGGHVKYVLEPFSELRGPILTSSSAKWRARCALFRKVNRKYGYRFPMPVICKKPTARTKKQRVENVEDQKFRVEK